MLLSHLKGLNEENSLVLSPQANKQQKAEAPKMLIPLSNIQEKEGGRIM